MDLFPEQETSEIPDWIPVDAWNAYISMRKSIKKPMTDYAKKLAIGKIRDLIDQGQSARDVLDQSTFNCWQGLFAVKDIVGKSASTPAWER